MLYLNVHEWDVRHKEIEADLHAATRLAKDTFTDVWLSWKKGLYHLWKDGEKTTNVFQQHMSLEDF